MALVEINWRPDAAALRRFGVSNLFLFGVAGAVFYLARDEKGLAGLFWILAGLNGLLGLTGHCAGLPLYYLIMGVGYAIGTAVGPLLIALFYYGMITPYGIVMRLRGRDKLCLRKPGAVSLWQDLPPPPSDPARYERQF